MCVATCSGQAIFILDEDYEEGFATVTLPYEFFPLPKEGDMGMGLSREGKFLGIKNDEIGAGAENHSTEYDIDEEAMPRGVALEVAYAIDFLNNEKK